MCQQTTAPTITLAKRKMKCSFNEKLCLLGHVFVLVASHSWTVLVLSPARVCHGCDYQTVRYLFSSDTVCSDVHQSRQRCLLSSVVSSGPQRFQASASKQLYTRCTSGMRTQSTTQPNPPPTPLSEGLSQSAIKDDTRRRSL